MPDLTTMLITWILCGVTAAIIAIRKQRSVAGWFCIGSLLGPIGVVLALVVP